MEHHPEDNREYQHELVRRRSSHRSGASGSASPNVSGDSHSSPRPRMQTALRRELSLKALPIRTSWIASNSIIPEQVFERQRNRHNDEISSKRTFAQRCDILESKLRHSLPVPQRENSLPVSKHENQVTMHSSILYNTLKALEWDNAITLVRIYPKLAQYIDKNNGFTPLHMACGRGSTPLVVIQALVAAFPQAVTIRTPYRKLHDTPLHLQARNSQATVEKLQALLPYANVKVTNRQGHTALHTACGNNAMIDALRALIVRDDSLLDDKDLSGRTPLSVLWEGYMQSIPGHLTIARILTGESLEPSASFRRFWAKMELLVSRGKTLDRLQLCHAMIRSNATSQMMEVALRMDPDLATCPDEQGNFLIHQLITHRYPFSKPLFNLAITSESVVACNSNGDTVLSLSVKLGMTAYIPYIRDAAPSLVTTIDVETQLFPFQLAAAHGCSTEVVYSLFLVSPDVIQY